MNIFTNKSSDSYRESNKPLKLRTTYTININSNQNNHKEAYLTNSFNKTKYLSTTYLNLPVMKQKKENSNSSSSNLDASDCDCFYYDSDYVDSADNYYTFCRQKSLTHNNCCISSKNSKTFIVSQLIGGRVVTNQQTVQLNVRDSNQELELNQTDLSQEQQFRILPSIYENKYISPEFEFRHNNLKTDNFVHFKPSAQKFQFKDKVMDADKQQQLTRKFCSVSSIQFSDTTNTDYSVSSFSKNRAKKWALI